MLGESDSRVNTSKVSEVDSQFSYCDKQRENLDSRIQILEGKLNPILRKTKEGESVCEKDSNELTPLANGIRKIGNDIGIFAGKIQDILDRIEI